MDLIGYDTSSSSRQKGYFRHTSRNVHGPDHIHRAPAAGVCIAYGGHIVVSVYMYSNSRKARNEVLKSLKDLIK